MDDAGAAARLASELNGIVDGLIAEIPESLEEADRQRFQEAVRRAQVINVRFEATWHLLKAMDIGEASLEFTRHADLEVRKHCQNVERPLVIGSAGIDLSRVFSYAEYCVKDAAGGGHIEGCLFYECGWSPQVNRRPAPETAMPLLQAFRLPLSGHVDRRLCAEFQLLSDLCGILSPGNCRSEPHPEVVGVISLFTTMTPCMSCIAAIRQFQLLFPEVGIGMGMLRDGDWRHAPKGA
mmetsp:Transcript_70009/g.204869  ORF Transcript_70009/g.204869 Transcript_70009/m.204869 type:complete len:237 (+) Transcript_70009:102-812(+)